MCVPKFEFEAEKYIRPLFKLNHKSVPGYVNFCLLTKLAALELAVRSRMKCLNT
jgi:hypothetical protein